MPTIDAYAEAVAAALGDRPVELFGYHTGVAIAVELATPHTLTGDLAQFTERWSYLVANGPEGVTLERGFGNVVDEFKAWPNGWWAHDAMFDWDADCAADPVITVCDVPLGALDR